MAAGQRRVVGVMGGMGPEATIAFMQRILELTPAQDDSDHVPLLVDNNTQVPSRIQAIIERAGEDPRPVLCDMARRLAAWGAEALAMPCNTAHFYAAAIAESVTVPFLNMVDMTAAQAIARWPGLRRIGLLASPAVRMTGVFDRAFTPYRIDIRYPHDNNAMLACIKAIKAGRRDRHTVAMLNGMIGELEADGAELAIIACSELSIVKEELNATLPKVDSVDVLAQAVVDFSTRSGDFTSTTARSGNHP